MLPKRIAPTKEGNRSNWLRSSRLRFLLKSSSRIHGRLFCIPCIHKQTVGTSGLWYGRSGHRLGEKNTMKFALPALCGLMLAGANVVSAQDATKKAEPELTVKQKASYGIGLNIGRNLKRQGLEDIDPQQLAKGILDVYAGKEPSVSEEDLETAIRAFQQELIAKQEEMAKAQGEKNRKAGEAFLAENKTKEGVKTLPSGVQYMVLKEGTGETPKATDTVTTHYRGTLIDGTEFDSSIKRGEPATFPVNGVISGWTEVLQLMKVGSKWRVFIPAAHAYGENPPPRSPIGPNSVLVFEIELLGINE